MDEMPDEDMPAEPAAVEGSADDVAAERTEPSVTE
jgi:hypothetical protein